MIERKRVEEICWKIEQGKTLTLSALEVHGLCVAYLSVTKPPAPTAYSLKESLVLAAGAILLAAGGMFVLMFVLGFLGGLFGIGPFGIPPS